MRHAVIFTFLVLNALSFGAGAAHASSVAPYDSYNYDYWEDIVFTPSPYLPGRSISGAEIGAGTFSGPQDMCVGPDGLVYIADTGNNRIVVLDAGMTGAVNIIDSFDNNGARDTFNAPYGVTVTDGGLLYVADSQNGRVVVLDGGRAVKVICDPESDMLESDGHGSFIFQPLKVAVDYAGRVYVIAFGVFQGIMVFDSEGGFTGFFGTINVKITLWEIIWRTLSTKAERSRQQLFIPTEFTGIDVDPDGFIYASNIDVDGKQAVRRINPKGEDVIRKGENENVGGDLSIGAFNKYSGPSYIIDVVYRGKGVYSLLDSKRGRIFTYDHEGNLLYIFGGLGTQAGTFKQPSAIESFGSRIAVLDASRNEIITFDETLYGRLINEAVALRYDGDESQAVEKWTQVLLLNENLELANVGIGKAYLTSGDNASAMKYLKLGKDRIYYSIAYKRYRNDILKASLSYVLTAVMALIAASFIYGRVRRRRNKDGGSKPGGGLLNDG